MPLHPLLASTCDQAALEGSGGGESVDDPDQEGSDLMSELMMEVRHGVGCFCFNHVNN